MSYLIATDLKTHLQLTAIQEITRADATITQEAIDGGIAEAQSYLSRYDIDALFGTATTAPTVVDVNLKNKVKDLVVWLLVRLSNVTANLELYKAAYDDAIKWFTKVSTGGPVAPVGWPYAPLPTTPAPDGDTIEWRSNPKRQNHY